MGDREAPPRYHILFVDDNEGFLRIGKFFLEMPGNLAVETVSSAEQAIEKLNCSSYDAILSDYQMPCMDGIELLRYVRAEFGAMPFILFTSDDDSDVVIKIRNLGADFCFRKGFDLREQFTAFEILLRQLIDKRREYEGHMI